MAMNLTEYGIFNENSDIRAHVSDHVVYVFRTHLAIKAIRNTEYRKVTATQPGINCPTARGFLVPPSDIEDCRTCRYVSWEYWGYYDQAWPTDSKGRWAVQCVVDMLAIGRFPLWLQAKQTADVTLDIEGTDILLAANQRIQVKCDYPAAKTGNLYLQTHEANPLHKY